MAGNQKSKLCLGKICVAFLLILFLSGCREKALNQQDLVKYIQDEGNGLKKSKTLGSMEVSVTYRPSDFIAVQELHNTKAVRPSNIDSLRDKFNPYLYFVLSLSKDGHELLNTMPYGADYSQSVMDLTFNLDKYVYLITAANDTIQMLDFVHPRLYGYAPSTEILTVFKRAEVFKADEFAFSLADMGFGMGTNKFVFKVRDITDCPALKY